MRHPVLLPLLILSWGLLWAPSGSDAADDKSGKIKKCQDAAGKWHYGDSAAVECQSKIEVISDQGIKRREIAAPPTEAELAQRELNKEEDDRQRKAAEEQKRKDQLLLATYGHEDDIKFVRDRKLAQIEATIKSNEQTLQSLRGVLARLEKQAEDEQKGGKAASDQTTRGLTLTQSQIASREAEIVTKRKEQEMIRKESEADLARYRELRKAPIKQPAAEKKP